MQKYTTNRRKSHIQLPQQNFSVRIWCRVSMEKITYIYILLLWSTFIWRASTITAFTFQQQFSKSIWKHSHMLMFDHFSHYVSWQPHCCFQQPLVYYKPMNFSYFPTFKAHTQQKVVEVCLLDLSGYVCPNVPTTCNPYRTQELGNKFLKPHNKGFYYNLLILKFFLKIQYIHKLCMNTSMHCCSFFMQIH